MRTRKTTKPDVKKVDFDEDNKENNPRGGEGAAYSEVMSLDGKEEVAEKTALLKENDTSVVDTPSVKAVSNVEVSKVDSLKANGTEKTEFATLEETRKMEPFENFKLEKSECKNKESTTGTEDSIPDSKGTVEEQKYCENNGGPSNTTSVPSGKNTYDNDTIHSPPMMKKNKISPEETPTQGLNPFFKPAKAPSNNPYGSPVKTTLSPFAKNPFSKVVPVSGLQAFGISASSTATSLAKRNGVLQFALVPGPDPFILVKLAPNGFWGEKKLFDALRGKENWLMPLDPYHTVFYHHKDGQAIRNARGYTVRIFALKCGEIPLKENLLSLGQYLCKNINNMEGNNTVASIDRNKLFFVDSKDGSCVFSDVVDTKQAYDLMLELADEAPSNDFYKRKKDLVHMFWRPGTFHPDLAQNIGAPAETVIGGMFPLDESNCAATHVMKE